MALDVYRKLAQFLDQLPAGFPTTDTGIEIKILRRLFTPEEAELALHLSLIEEKAAVIAYRAKRPLREVAALLAQMEKKGLIYARHKGDQAPRYSATQFVVGIYEFQVNKMDPEIAGYFEEYLPHYFQPEVWKEAPQIRTIPIGESLDPEFEIMDYESAEALIRAQTKFSLAPCICRQEKAILGEACDKPLESCMSFGSGADFYVRNGMGRYITQAEALEVLKLAEESGLVLQPGAARESSFICTCCGCCCGVLTNLKRYAKPAEIALTSFIAVHNEERCDGCELCIERCQMEAVLPYDGLVRIDGDRCIGCGLCVTSCLHSALSLERKPGAEKQTFPSTFMETNLRLGKARGVLSNRKVVDMLRQSKQDRATVGKGSE
jgi:ferredoxin